MAAQRSSCVCVARSSSGRSKAIPRGHESKPKVAEGNSLNDRAALLCWIASMLQVAWVIEQPASSLFFDTKHMSSVITQCGAKRIHLWLYDYGHPARKATIFVGTTAWLASFACTRRGNEDAKQVAANKPCMKGQGKGVARAKPKGKKPLAKATRQAGAWASKKRPKPMALCKVTTTSAGKRHASGKSACVKASQVYPVRLAIAILRARFPGAFQQ